MTNKKLLRRRYLAVRREIPLARREEAKKNALLFLKERLNEKKRVVSYFPLPEEVDVSLFNLELAARGALILPRIEKDHLEIYLINDYKKGLSKSKHRFLEPIPKQNTKVEEADIILIPGVAFDQWGHRIGFGKGYYDQFLKRNPRLIKIGITFREQISPERIISEEHDVPMDQLCIV